MKFWKIFRIHSDKIKWMRLLQNEWPYLQFGFSICRIRGPTKLPVKIKKYFQVFRIEGCNLKNLLIKEQHGLCKPKCQTCRHCSAYKSWDGMRIIWRSQHKDYENDQKTIYFGGIERIDPVSPVAMLNNVPALMIHTATLLPGNLPAGKM